MGSAAVLALLLLLVSGCDRQPAAEPSPLRLIEDFERENALGAWQFRQVDAAAEIDSASAGRRARLRYRKWSPGSSKWPSARLALGDGIFDTQDWRDFSSLKFDAWSSHGRAIPLKIRIDDADGHRSVALVSVAARQGTTCEIPLRQLATDIDLAHISKIDLYMTQPAADRDIVVDGIRLEAGALTLIEQDLSVDPFGAGRFSAKVGFNRRARASMELVGDESGSITSQFADTARQLSWQHDGGNLQPGRYRVRLRATEPAEVTAIASTIERDLGSFEVLPPSQQPELLAWTESSTRKVLLHSRPAPDQVVYDLLADSSAEGLTPARLEMARNEHEAVQVVVLSRRQTVELSVAVEKFRLDGAAAILPPSSAEVFQVGYVKTEQPREYAVEFAGWWPDALLPKDRMAALPGECMPVWISIQTTKKMQPGIYRGSVRVEIRMQGEGAVDWHLPLEVLVHQATLPDTTTIRTAFSLRRFMLDRIYGEPRATELFGKYRDFVAGHRLNVTDLYRNSVPALHEVALGARAGTLNAFNLIQVSSDDADSDRLEEISAHLDPFVNLLRELGIADRAYIYGFDEARGTTSSSS